MIVAITKGEPCLFLEPENELDRELIKELRTLLDRQSFGHHDGRDHWHMRTEIRLSALMKSPRHL